MIYVIVVLWGTTPAPLVDVGNMHGLLLENLSRKENMSIPLYLYIYNCPDATGAVNYYYDDGPLEIASPIKRTHTSNPKKNRRLSLYTWMNCKRTRVISNKFGCVLGQGAPGYLFPYV